MSIDAADPTGHDAVETAALDEHALLGDVEHLVCCDDTPEAYSTALCGEDVSGHAWSTVGHLTCAGCIEADMDNDFCPLYGKCRWP